MASWPNPRRSLSDIVRDLEADVEELKGATTTTSVSESVQEAPSVRATKAEWVDYATSVGVETEGLTKDQIISAIQE